MLDINDVKDAVPIKYRTNISQKTVDALNNLSTDPEEAKLLADNFVTYTSVLKDGKFKLNDYLNAVKYVSFKMLGNNNREAYKKTFPARYKDKVDRNISDKDINSAVAAYNQGVLVTKVVESAIVPSWILNQDKYQKAVNTLTDIMSDSFAPMRERVTAAIGILTHVKKPEIVKSEMTIDVDVKNNGMDILEQRLNEFSQMQLASIKDNSISTQNIIDVPLKSKEAEEV